MTTDTVLASWTKPGFDKTFNRESNIIEQTSDDKTFVVYIYQTDSIYISLDQHHDGSDCCIYIYIYIYTLLHRVVMTGVINPMERIFTTINTRCKVRSIWTHRSRHVRKCDHHTHIGRHTHKTCTYSQVQRTFGCGACTHTHTQHTHTHTQNTHTHTHITGARQESQEITHTRAECCTEKFFCGYVVFEREAREFLVSLT